MNVAASVLAERISATLTEKCLEWGEAINEAEAARGGSTHELLTKIARMRGLEVANLSAAVAAKLRPLEAKR